MFYGDTIQETRQMFFIAWKKFQNKELLSPLEHEITQVILAHPEFHPILDNPINIQQPSCSSDEPNPFLHMGLHIAIREQISTDRPKGISIIYKNLLKKHHDLQRVEHLMMEQLAQVLWQSQKNNTPIAENDYLQVLAHL